MYTARAQALHEPWSGLFKGQQNFSRQVYAAAQFDPHKRFVGRAGARTGRVLKRALRMHDALIDRLDVLEMLVEISQKLSGTPGRAFGKALRPHEMREPFELERIRRQRVCLPVVF
jgi:hypothetical protein